MFEGLKKTVQQIRQYPPGERFVRHYQKRQAKRSHLFYKVLFMSGGFLVVLIGFFLLAFPGPGILTIIIGLGLIAQESILVARLLDWLEIHVRRWIVNAKEKWYKASLFSKTIFFILLTIVLALLVLMGFVFFLW